MICKEIFGQHPHGTVERYILSNSQGMSVSVITYGAILQEMVSPSGQDVCLGYDTLEEYLSRRSFYGGIVGRCANRIAGASFLLDGRYIPLTVSQAPNHLHGGFEGFDCKLWQAVHSDDNSVTLYYRSPDGEEGYPGNLDTYVTYRLDEDNGLWIHYEATPDSDTIVNLTNHAFFNLTGSSILDHTLWINADHYTPLGGSYVPTGEITPVDDTAYDFRTAKTLSAALNQATSFLDRNLCLNGEGFRPVASLRGGNLVLEMSTDAPGMQLYCNVFSKPICGKSGKIYDGWCSVCLEAQAYPDAVHHPNFPSTIVKAGNTYSQTTLYRLSNEEIESRI